MLKNKQRMILKISMLTVMLNVKGMEKKLDDVNTTMDTTLNDINMSMDISMAQESKSDNMIETTECVMWLDRMKKNEKEYADHSKQADYIKNIMDAIPNSMILPSSMTEKEFIKKISPYTIAYAKLIKYSYLYKTERRQRIKKNIQKILWITSPVDSDVGMKEVKELEKACAVLNKNMKKIQDKLKTLPQNCNNPDIIAEPQSQFNLQELDDLFTAFNVTLELLSKTKSVCLSEQKKIEAQIEYFGQILCRDENGLCFVSKKNALKLYKQLSSLIARFSKEEEAIKKERDGFKKTKDSLLVNMRTILNAKFYAMVIPEKRDIFFNKLEDLIYSDNDITRKEGVPQLCNEYFVKNNNTKEENQQMISEYIDISHQIMESTQTIVIDATGVHFYHDYNTDNKK